MKRPAGTLIFLVLLTHYAAFAQSGKALQPGYYVVVSANSAGYSGFAQEYVEVLKKMGYKSADYGMDVRRNIYLVYVEYFQGYKPALQRMQDLRNAGEFTDAWVRVVTGDLPARSGQPAPPESGTEDRPATAAGGDPVTEEQVRETEDRVTEEPVAVEEKKLVPDDYVVMERPTTRKPNTLADIRVFLSLINPTNNRIVEGDVQVVDTERGKLIVEVPGNEELLLPDPGTATGVLSLISDVFGYRRVQYEIDYDQPLVATRHQDIEFVDNILVINFELQRLSRGDRAILYNVYFYTDAAVMRPESIYELNSLVDMMRENPDYKIRLHGHTNDRYYGEMLLPGPDKEYFAITDEAIRKNATAKTLSRERAETIKSYLVDQGIASSRVEVKPWGGKKPLYDRVGENAAKNVRVEVEILKD
jgi:outer membrane protein OmpA-like peptidoglycan-associated protein